MGVSSSLTAARTPVPAHATMNPARPALARQAAPSPVQAAPGPRWSIGGLPLWPSLTVGAVDDPQEKEADSIADRVMRMADPAVATTPEPMALRRDAAPGAAREEDTLRRACPECEEDDKLKRAPAAATVAAPRAPVPASVHAALAAPGRAMDAATRGFFEPRLGRTLGEVRLHTDDAASRSARDVGALAYTVGRDVVFGAGMFDPQSATGRRLLAHELAHVVQHAGGAGFRPRSGPEQGAPTGTPAP